MEATYPEIAVDRQKRIGHARARVLRHLSAGAPSSPALTRRIPSHLPSRLRPPHTPSQEFWHASEDVRNLYERGLAAAGYVVHVTPRTGGRPDGLLTAVRSADFDVVERRDVLFNDCGDRVAARTFATHPNPNPTRDIAPIPSATSSSSTRTFSSPTTATPLIRLRESFKILEYLHSTRNPRRRTSSAPGKTPKIARGDVRRFQRHHTRQRQPVSQISGFLLRVRGVRARARPSADGPRVGSLTSITTASASASTTSGFSILRNRAHRPVSGPHLLRGRRPSTP